MGPMGYGRGAMSLMGMARGGGYGGYNPYQQQMGRNPMSMGAPQMGGFMQNLAASPQMQALRDRYAGQGPQGSSWEQAPPGGMQQGAPQGGAAPPGMGAHLSAEAKKQELMAQGMSEEDAHRGAMQTYQSQMGPPPPQQAMPQQGGWQGAMGSMGAAGSAMQQDPSYLAAKRWASEGPAQWNAGPVNAPSAFGAALLGAAQQGPPSSWSTGGQGMGGWGGPMSLGALARMGMFRR